MGQPAGTTHQISSACLRQQRPSRTWGWPTLWLAMVSLLVPWQTPLLQAADAPVPLLIAAAADLQFALPDVLAAFTQAHPEIAPKTTFGSSGTLVAQIENGAPFDLYLAADTKFPKVLIEHGHAEAATLFTYASGHLVVWVPTAYKGDLMTLGMHVLEDPRLRKIAIANPKVAPYGAAAEAALHKAGIYEAVQGRLVLGENVGQAAQFAQSGAADAGLISLAQALSPKMQGAGRYWEVPAEFAPPFPQAGVICTSSKNRAGAAALSSFLQGEPGRAILARYGFTLPAAAP